MSKRVPDRPVMRIPAKRSSKRGRCRHGRPDCDFNSDHELALVEGILRTIEQHIKKENAAPCPLCLRNAMLAVAALLHLDAARIESERGGKPRAAAKHVSDALAKAAREALGIVAEAKAAIVASHSKH